MDTGTPASRNRWKNSSSAVSTPALAPMPVAPFSRPSAALDLVGDLLGGGEQVGEEFVVELRGGDTPRVAADGERGEDPAAAVVDGCGDRAQAVLQLLVDHGPALLADLRDDFAQA